MYEHVVVENLSQTEQEQGAISPVQISKASTCRSERDNASGQTELARASVSSSICTARCVFKTNEEIEIHPAKYIYITTHKVVEPGVMREWFAFISSLDSIQHCSFSPFYAFRTCIGRPGYFPGAWSSWIFASCQFEPKIVDLSVRFIRILFNIFFLVSKRSGGNSTIQR